jgi:hypothetical protein
MAVNQANAAQPALRQLADPEDWLRSYRASHPFAGAYRGAPLAVAGGWAARCGLCGGVMRGYWRQRIPDSTTFVTAYECQQCHGLSTVGDDGAPLPNVPISRYPRGRQR